MNTEGKVLDILFRQISPERLLRSLKQRVDGTKESLLREKAHFDCEKQDIFIDFAESTLSGYSEDEQKILYQQLGQIKSRWENHHALPSGFFTFLIKYGLETLVIAGGEPRCRPEKTLSWRDTYLRIGQDIIVCPFLAYLDFQNGIIRSDFTWPAVLRIDDNELYHLLGQGIAENHNHINGGTQSFPLTWCRLMNYPEKIRTELKHFTGSSLHFRITRKAEDSGLSLSEQLELAALLRSILFRALHRNEFRNTPSRHWGDLRGSGPVDAAPFSGKQAFQDEYLLNFSFGNSLYDLIDCLKMRSGVQLEYPDGKVLCLDYVLDNAHIQYCVHSHIRVLAGERLFLYQCVQACLRKNGFDAFEQSLLYLYLLLKCNFRSEMIQANNQTGFKNFMNYQDRKDDAWDENPYFWEAARMALNDPLDNGSVVSLEGRLVPKADPDINIQKVYRFDRAKRFADCATQQALDPMNYEFDRELDVERFAHLPYFFLYHFIKVKDNRELKYGDFSIIPCRHQLHRQNLRAAAIGLATALRMSTYLRNRIRGIDASASEIGCRPEVFAAVYRYFSGVQQKWNTRLDALLPSSPMRISKAYHVGEDFLDIADGLRAIDEAITFLRLERGSRIGHALAMGIIPEDHYCIKDYTIITTKQDRLDDLVWLLYRTKELGVSVDGQMESTLQDEAYQLFRELYGDAINHAGWNCGLMDYYHSMKLRGDDPSVYTMRDSKVIIRHPLDVDNEFNHYLLSKSDSILAKYREEDQIVGLYYRYHYGITEGIRGQETVTCGVSKSYIQLIQRAQDAMQQYCSERGIIIECNPSSNVLIGTFKQYDRHPIFRFNNQWIESHQGAAHPQLHVCVNTDDLGIFDTSLEFEYALIQQVLLTQIDDSSHLKYNARVVKEYLNALREMGIAATFPENI